MVYHAQEGLPQLINSTGGMCGSGFLAQERVYGRHEAENGMWVQRETDEKRLSCPNLLRVLGANTKKGRDLLNVMANKTSALGDSPVFLRSDYFGLVCQVANTDAINGSRMVGCRCGKDECGRYQWWTLHLY